MEKQRSKVKNKKFKLKLKNFLAVAFLVVILNFAFLILNLEKSNASDFSLGIYPPLIRIQTTTPNNIETPLNIQNFSDRSIKLKVLFKPFEKNSSLEESIKDHIFLVDKNTKISELELQPRQTKNLYLQLNFPIDKISSDYYFSIVFISSASSDTPIGNDSKNEKVARTNIIGGIATNVLLSVNPNGKSKGSINEFSTKRFVEKGPIDFKIQIQNQGNHVIQPEGTIIIKNMFGQTIGNLDLDSAYILKNSDRLFSSSWKENFLLGTYTATLNLKLSPDSPILTRTIHFVALPYKILISAFFISSLYLFFKARLKRYKK